MKTGCFFTYKGDRGVSIALSQPRDHSLTTYRKLLPTWAMINNYKQDRDKRQATKDYEEVYRAEVLDKLDPFVVYAELNDSVILCWEKAGDFCHRRLVAEWLSETIGVKVPEL